MDPGIEKLTAARISKLNEAFEDLEFYEVGFQEVGNELIDELQLLRQALAEGNLILETAVADMSDRLKNAIDQMSLDIQGVIVFMEGELLEALQDIETAIKEAANLRFRPIMMTSLSTMIAMLPLVIGNIGPGAGEGSRLAVGATILGGMIISTIFTLYVTPSMYLALAKNTKRIDFVDIELNKQLTKK